MLDEVCPDRTMLAMGSATVIIAARWLGLAFRTRPAVRLCSVNPLGEPAGCTRDGEVSARRRGWARRAFRSSSSIEGEGWPTVLERLLKAYYNPRRHAGARASSTVWRSHPSKKWNTLCR